MVSELFAQGFKGKSQWWPCEDHFSQKLSKGCSLHQCPAKGLCPNGLSVHVVMRIKVAEPIGPLPHMAAKVGEQRCQGLEKNLLHLQVETGILRRSYRLERVGWRWRVAGAWGANHWHFHSPRWAVNWSPLLDGYPPLPGYFIFRRLYYGVYKNGWPYWKKKHMSTL